MKVTVVQTYQSVKFNGNGRHSHETFFCKRDIMPELQLEVLDHGMKITTPHDHVVVPWANIQYYKVDMSEPIKAAKPMESKAQKPKND